MNNQLFSRTYKPMLLIICCAVMINILSSCSVKIDNNNLNITEDEAKAIITDIIPKAALFSGNIFNGSGHFDVDRSVTIPGTERDGEYVLVVDDNIKSVADLIALVEEVFTPEVAETRFYRYIKDLDKPIESFDYNYYTPLYYDYESQLYVNDLNGGHGFAFEWLYDTIKVTELSNNAITAEIDRMLFGEFDETSVIKLEKRNGRWLVANDFIDKTDE